MTQAFNLSQLANNLNSSGQLDATDGLVNAVPASNGGTGVSTLTGVAYGNGTNAFTAATSTQLKSAIGTLAVGDGGTGATSFTSGSLLRGNGTSALSSASGSDIATAIGSTYVANATYATSSGNGGVTSVNGKTGAVQSAIVSSTAWNYSTPVAVVDFGSIPSWAKRVTVTFANVSLNVQSYVLIQLIYGSGTVVTTGYRSSGFRANGTNSTSESPSTQGFVFNVPSASDDLWGNVSIVNLTSNTWTASGNVTYASGLMSTTGGIAIPGSLTGVRITTVSGTSTFDSGSINMMYE